MRWKMRLLATVAGFAISAGVASAEEFGRDRGNGEPDGDRRFAHVLLISVDGLHAADLRHFLADPANGGSALADLAGSGTIYPRALTTAPSDSFPGMLAQLTGGTPKSTGVFYDDAYDRTYFAPGSDCSGPPGAEVHYAENVDFVTARLDGGGTLGQPLTQIDPAKLPRSLISGVCTPMLPHSFLRVNTIFEVIRGHGLHTAWSDKHPSYEIVNGPSGTGVVDLFTPEIDSDIPGVPGQINTSSFTATRNYDEIKVQAVLHEIRGMNSTGTAPAPVPAIFGMNFQSVSVGQKLAKSGALDPAGLVGGYVDAAGTPGRALALQIAYVDGALRRMVTALHEQGLADDTMIIVSAKHGQSPIDRSTRIAIDDGPYASTPGYDFHVADDAALVWLKPSRQVADAKAAAAYLRRQFAPLGIHALLGRDELKELFRDPRNDSRTPDFLAVSNHGVIYTGGSKLAEHGGLAAEDRSVALLVSAPSMEARVSDEKVETRQIAPTILRALGIDPRELQATRIEHTRALPDLDGENE